MSERASERRRCGASSIRWGECGVCVVDEPPNFHEPALDPSRMSWHRHRWHGPWPAGLRATTKDGSLGGSIRCDVTAQWTLTPHSALGQQQVAPTELNWQAGLFWRATRSNPPRRQPPLPTSPTSPTSTTTTTPNSRETAHHGSQADAPARAPPRRRCRPQYSSRATPPTANPPVCRPPAINEALRRQHVQAAERDGMQHAPRPLTLLCPPLRTHTYTKGKREKADG